MAYLEIRNLSKRFGDFVALDQVNFEIEQSEIVVLLGPSGGGKTTLLRCLTGLETIDEGEILLNGKALDDHLAFGLVFQQFELFPQYTAKQNITLSPKLRGLFSPEEIEKHANALLEHFGLSEHADHYPHQLSGGQKQRVALARAMILEPAILCLDEPTSALDQGLTSTVAELILGLKAAGMTLLVVTHDQSFAQAIADRILRVEKGKVYD